MAISLVGQARDRSKAGWTPPGAAGSRFLLAAALGLAACADGRAEPPAASAPSPGHPATPTAPTARHPAAAAETCLGVADRGIWSDLDDDLQLTLPGDLTPDRVTATVDPARPLLVLAVDGWPTKPYPLTGAAELVVGDHRLALRPGDRAELAPLLTAANLTSAAATPDRDRDGIPDPLDVLLGARKTAINADAYVGGYESLRYPMGDVARDHGVCTDVVVRALRNAGVDLQAELHADIARAPRSYPMVKGRGDPNIDHRRVKTLLPYLRRHLDQRSAALDDPADPVRPGDLVLFDTFPSRSGPDHIGVVSDRRGEHGHLLVINNWTDGSVTGEMDLLAWVPVTHRFRLR
ncbi:MAG: DUF1287 domain-containing protein [Myxococcales bacterium]|nr:DUF1287 domain-containing protein [Myxococcales bacterium]MBP6846744.1 DUF1287 domain-containing protein [Kofleriaceae bacterium]